MLQSGDTVPNFSQQSSQGKIDFYDWAEDSWIVLFSHPADYTSVFTFELGNVAKLKPEFDRRGVKVIALSTKDRETYQDWIDGINRTQNTTVNYPIVADVDKSVSDLYGIIDPDENAKPIVRTVLVIDPQKKVHLTISDPPNLGSDFQETSSERDFQDILRTINSLRSEARDAEASPVVRREASDLAEQGTGTFVPRRRSGHSPCPLGLSTEH